MRVFVLSDHFVHKGGRAHGGTTYLLNSLPAMSAAGVRLTAVFMGESHPLTGRLRDAGVDVQCLHLSKWDPRSLYAFWPFLRAQPFDLLHLLCFKSHLVGQLAAARLRMPAVVHVHDRNVLPPPLRMPMRWASRNLAALVGVSEPVTRFAAQQYGVPLSRCHTIENGLDFAAFARPACEGRGLREELGLDERRRLIAVVGRVQRFKGQLALIECMPEIARRVPEACLLVVGDGPDRAQCERAAAELGVREHVRFLGHRDDVARILSEVEISVMPTQAEEGLPYAVLEAMSAGLAVLASDAGGIGTLIQSERNGLLVKRGDRSELIAGVLRLLADDALRARLGSAARERAADFSVERHVERMLSLYDSVLSAAGLRAGKGSPRPAAPPL